MPLETFFFLSYHITNKLDKAIRLPKAYLRWNQKLSSSPVSTIILKWSLPKVKLLVQKGLHAKVQQTIKENKVYE